MKSHVSFLTVPIELQAIALACNHHLQSSGFRLKHENNEHDYPETATIDARRKGERRFYIFDDKVKAQRIVLWSSYARSCQTSTFVVLCIRKKSILKPADLVMLKSLGVGLIVIDDDAVISEVVPAVDLTMNITLPPLNRHRVAMRRQLQSIHEHFRNGEWKAGFEEACKLVEKSAREYLVRQIKASSVSVPGKAGQPRNISVDDAKRLPLGALADVFCMRLYPKQIDSHLCDGLKRINPDRINVAHKKLTSATERRLRTNVARHMWTIHNLLRQIPA
jgi:hypothetical protein